MPLLEFTPGGGYTNPHLGDEKCNHTYDEYDLTKSQGIVFCTWTCTRCGRQVDQLIGEAFPPEKGKDSAYDAMDTNTHQSGDCIPKINKKVKKQ
jgi:hypothetical protein